jgi:FAD binding domain/Berberine and berberine like
MSKQTVIAAAGSTMRDGLGGLRDVLTGSVLEPTDDDYDTARTVWNAAIDRRPALIAQCASPADVAAAILFAREQGFEITVRGGAHSTAGASVADESLMIDLRRMNEVRVDPEAKRTRVGGGALLRDMDAATQAHGLAVPAGLVGHTGVAGLTLGGGMGWLSRLFGLTLDNLLAAEVVTADGQVRRAAEDENPDLFWAIRGGGGNFGVVTAFEFRAHQVGPIVHFGLFFWPAVEGREALCVMRDVIHDLPRDMNAIVACLNAPPAPFVPQQHHFVPGYALLLTGFGSTEEHAKVANDVRSRLAPLFDVVAPIPYVELQQLLDEANAWGQLYYDKGTDIPHLSDDMIAVVTEQMPRRSSPLSVALGYPLDGAFCDIGENDTAFGGTRAPHYAWVLVGAAQDPAVLAAERDWVRSFWDALQPFALGIGSYVNLMTEFEPDRVRASYGRAKHDRLAHIKAKYDPGNLFHHNANIKPSEN